MSDGVARVHYFPQQFLRSEDFVDEQSYHLTGHRRHNIGHHTWGIVAGLELTTDDEGRLFVEAGAAVDGFGRDVVYAQRRQIGPEVFADRDSDVLDVYLNYHRVGSDEAPPGYAGCLEGDDPPFYRWQEQPFLTFGVPQAPPVDRRKPPDVLDTDVDFDATRVPPDEPERRWPVFLGQVTLDRENDAQPFTVDPAGRPYVGLVGEMIHAPSGRARVQIGAERHDDPNRFAVFIPEAEDPSTSGQPRLAFRADGTAELLGDTNLHGDLTVAGYAVEFEVAAEPPSTTGDPRMYHVEAEVDGAPGQELRIEMVDQSTPQQVVIGAWSAEDGAFKPCLTIRNDCTVTVHGDLVVEGLIDERDESQFFDAGLSDEAQLLATTAFTSGITGGNALLSTVYGSPFPDGPQVTLETAATAIAAASPQQRDMWAHVLRTQHPQIAAALRDALAADAPHDVDDGDEDAE